MDDISPILVLVLIVFFIFSAIGDSDKVRAAKKRAVYEHSTQSAILRAHLNFKCNFISKENLAQVWKCDKDVIAIPNWMLSNYSLAVTDVDYEFLSSYQGQNYKEIIFNKSTVKKESKK